MTKQVGDGYSWEITTDYSFTDTDVKSANIMANGAAENALSSTTQGFFVRTKIVGRSTVGCPYEWQGSSTTEVDDQTPWSYIDGQNGHLNFSWQRDVDPETLTHAHYKRWGLNINFMYTEPPQTVTYTMTNWNCAGDTYVDEQQAPYSKQFRMKDDQSLWTGPDGANSKTIVGRAAWRQDNDYSFTSSYELTRGLDAEALLHGTPTGQFPQHTGDLGRPALVSLGDSYQSGEGTAFYDPATDLKDPGPLTLANTCHRGLGSMGTRATDVFNQQGSPGWYNLNIACSGAVAQDINSRPYCGPDCETTDDRLKELPQLTQLTHIKNALGSNLKVVTLGIGGNDAGFSEVVGTCIGDPRPNGPVQDCVDFFEYEADTDESAAARVRAAAEAAEYTLNNVRARVGPDVTIVLMGYPVFMDDAWNNPELDCPGLIDDNEAAYVRGRILQLNRRLEYIANQQPNTRYLSLDTVYQNRGVCQPDGREFINKLVFDPPSPKPTTESFHPNQEGVTLSGDRLALCLLNAADCGTASSEPMPLPSTLADAATGVEVVVDTIKGMTLRAAWAPAAGSRSVDVYLESTPTYVGSVTADETGQLSADFEVPANIAPGEHTLVLRTDAQPGAEALRVETRIPVTVTDGASAAPAAIQRLSGADRLGTAIAISKAAWPDQAAQSVVLARHDAFPDALAGTPLAVRKNGPLLLTPSTGLHAGIAAEIKRVLPTGRTVHLLGGPAALSQGVADAVARLGYKVTRLGGADRYATAVTISTQLGTPSRIFEATGLSFQNALISGVAAASSGGVVVLTADAQMPAATRGYLDGLPGVERVAVGAHAGTADPSATRVAGATVYDTARLVAERFFPTPRAAALASGTVFADALSGGAHIGRLGGPLLLSEPTRLPAPIAGYLSAHRASIDTATLYGGPAALAGAVEDGVRANLRQ